MDLIIDSNVTHFCVDPENHDGRAIVEWLRQNGKCVAGGELRREYEPNRGGNAKFLRLFLTLRTAGRAYLLRDEDVDERAAQLRSIGTLKSNDAHIIAVAQLSGARALWSDDRLARQDFGNKDLIDRPRGRFYLPKGSPKRRAAGLRAISRVL